MCIRDRSSGLRFSKRHRKGHCALPAQHTSLLRNIAGAVAIIVEAALRGSKGTDPPSFLRLAQGST
eukprot:4866039-Alexandrium_andersonii.AAC.1